MATLRIKEVEEENTRTAKSVMRAGGLRCDVEMHGHQAIIDEPEERALSEFWRQSWKSRFRLTNRRKR